MVQPVPPPAIPRISATVFLKTVELGFKWARVPKDLKKEIKKWTGNPSPVENTGLLNCKSWTGGGFILKSYAVPRYPTLRIQRTAWPLVPLFGAACSFYLSWSTWKKRRNTRRFVVADLHRCSKQVRLST